VSKNPLFKLGQTELKRVDPDSRQIGTAANGALLAAKLNYMSEERCELSVKITPLYYLH